MQIRDKLEFCLLKPLLFPAFIYIIKFVKIREFFTNVFVVLYVRNNYDFSLAFDAW